MATRKSPPTEKTPAQRLGDMPPDEFLRQGEEAIRWIAEYLERPEVHPVYPDVSPRECAVGFGADYPEGGVDFTTILRDFREQVVPGITHWNHPNFFAYFATTGSAPGVIGEALAAALNPNAMLWRTSPAATELEEVTLDWLRQMVGLSEVFRGHLQDTASTSTMVALAAAREAAGIQVRELGLTGRDLPQLMIYCSEEAHSSVDKAAIALGFGIAGVRHIATDTAYRLRTEELTHAIDADLAAGVKPVAVVGTIGTTSSTSVDPIPEVAAICERHRIWLHVDAAYAGSAAVVPEMRHWMEGWERADSIVINPHKWMFVPMDCSALYLRDPETLRRAFHILPDYLKTPEGGDVTNLMEYGPALGRRFRALKLWMVFRYFGRAGLAERIGEHLRLARLFAGLIEETEGWEVMAPVNFSTVCFRYAPAGGGPPGDVEAEAEKLNERILTAVNATREIFLSPTRLKGEYCLRLAIGNIRTAERHVERAWELLTNAAREVGG